MIRHVQTQSCLTFTVPLHYLSISTFEEIYKPGPTRVIFRIFCSRAPDHVLLAEEVLLPNSSVSDDALSHKIRSRARAYFEALKSLGGCTTEDEEEFGDVSPQYTFEKILASWIKQATALGE